MRESFKFVLALFVFSNRIFLLVNRDKREIKFMPQMLESIIEFEEYMFVDDIVKNIKEKERKLVKKIEEDLNSLSNKICEKLALNILRKQKKYCDTVGHSEFASIPETKNTEFSCPFCGFKCKRKIGLLQHIDFKHIADDKERRYQKCKYCLISFHLKSSLSIHLKRTHRDHGTSKLEYKCLFCEKTTKQIKSMKIHTDRMHEKDKVGKYFCDSCPRSFNYKNNIGVHVRWHFQDYKKCKR